MHPLLHLQLAADRRREVARRCERAHLLRPDAPAAVTTRPLRARDVPAVRRLAALEAKPLPAGPVLVAEVDGSVEAALPLAGGQPVANPFAATADVLALLEVRAQQVRRAA